MAGRREDSLAQPLLAATPRDVELTMTAKMALMLAAALVAGAALLGGDLYRRAAVSHRHVVRFPTEAVPTTGHITRVRRSGDDNPRYTLHYQYAAEGISYTGSARVRRTDPRASQGAIAVRYLASEPRASWIEGQAPREESLWPAYGIPLAALGAAAGFWTFIHRQRQLLAYGRPALARVTKLDKKKSDEGSHWRVEYEWSLLSGATRKGHFNHGLKNPPPIGSPVSIVYDRENPSRRARYPLKFVSLRRT